MFWWQILQTEQIRKEYHMNSTEAVAMKINWATQGVKNAAPCCIPLAVSELPGGGLPAFISEIYPVYQLQINFPRALFFFLVLSLLRS